MSFDGEKSRWMCGRSGVVNLHPFSSMVREIRDPCLHHWPSKGSKMLNPEKWQAIFDSDGKVIGFGKALKLIVLGGVDPSIRAEVWEFLLGCYALNSTFEYRKQLRMARRERYDDLIRQCQLMHSSVGTGSLAYVVGSKVMDTRTLSRENDIREAVTENGQASCDATNKLETYSDLNNGCTDTSYAHERKNSSRSAQLVSCRMSIDDSAYDSSYVLPSSKAYDCYPRNFDSDFHEPQYGTESFFDIPPLPVINLFQKDDGNENETQKHEHTLRFGEEHMNSFQINNNVDRIMESNSPPIGPLCSSNGATDIFRSNAPNRDKASKEIDCSIEGINRSTIPDAPKEATVDRTTTSGLVANEDRISEWLWTLHRIVIDVVRTDSHLEFYGESKNMARMSDILAVYAWIDPATGYCQGMSDLLSPFVVLYEDNADAFWCFEMLLRRMRENFQIEGPTGVMKQLQALWKILELTDLEISQHLLLIGAESLHFAFRMLLVLFRRELSFDEALRMWEMIWAADFDEALTRQFEENCLDPLVLNFQDNSQVAIKAENMENGERKFKSMQPQCRNGKACAPYSSGVRSIPGHPLCGLTKANFWSRHDRLQVHNTTASMRKGDDGLPAFCVAAILIINRQKIMRETHSFDDIIKMFNDKMLKINVKRCIRMAIKLRKKYCYKLKLPPNILGSSCHFLFIFLWNLSRKHCGLFKTPVVYSFLLLIQHLCKPISAKSSDLTIYFKALEDRKVESAILSANLEPCIELHLVAAAMLRLLDYTHARKNVSHIFLSLCRNMLLSD